MMTPDELRLFAEMATELMSTGRVDVLIDDLADSGLADSVWDDPIASAALFEAHGRHLVTSVLLDLLVLRQPGGRDPLRLVLPPLGSSAPPGRVEGSLIQIAGVVTNGQRGRGYLVGTDRDDMLVIEPALLDIESSSGFDPDLGLARIGGAVCLNNCRPGPGGVDWDTVSARAARAIGSELLGVGQGALALASEHVRERRQFGQPLSALQAVRHRLADAQVAQTGARELLAATDERLPARVQTQLVKALAGRSALLAVAAAQQVCGAMGFTDEFGLHRYVRRAYLLDSVFGGSEAAEGELGSLALAAGLTPDTLVSLS
jgi:hypothetical protein